MTTGKNPTTVGAAVQDCLTPQCETIRALDPALTVKTVHRTRKAIRRVRSVLRTFDDVFDPESATRLAEDAAWLATLLGEVRDADVMLARLAPESPQDATPDRDEILAELTSVRQKAASAAVEALASPRYLHLRQQLSRWRDDPPLTTRADAPADTMLAYLSTARQIERKRLRSALEFGSSHETLHRARKAAKRHRYAGEVARPVLKPKARRKVKRSKAIQEILGRHQDSIVATDFLEDQPFQQEILRRLLAAERNAAARSREEFRAEMES